VTIGAPPPAGTFLVALSRRNPGAVLDAQEPPRGATRDEDGRWIVGDVLLTDCESLRAPLGAVPPRSDEALALAAIARHGAGDSLALHGEFAFVAWDAPNRRLLVARDGLGLRPCFVAVTAEMIGVSNDPALLARQRGVDASLDEGALAAYLVDGMDPDATRTVYRGVRSVPAGHTWQWDTDAGAPTVRRHWCFPAPAVRRPRDARELPERFNLALDAAVRDRVRGPRASILLSGGIDSSSIAASLRDACPDVELRAWTATYEPLLADRETPWTRRVAEHLGVPLEVVGCAASPAVSPVGEPALPAPLDEPTWTEWRRLVQSAGSWSDSTFYGVDGDALLAPASLAGMLRAERLPDVANAIVSYAVRRRRLPHLGTGLLRLVRRGAGSPARPAKPAWLRDAACAAAAVAPAFDVEPLAPHPSRGRSQSLLTSPVWHSLVPSWSAPWTGAATAFRLPLLDDRLLEVVMSAPSVPWLNGKELMRAAAELRGALPADVIRRPKLTVRGHTDALVAAWRAHWDGAVQIAPEIAAWVDAAMLRRALAEGSTFDVADAWRVLELSAWLDDRRTRTT